MVKSYAVRGTVVAALAIAAAGLAPQAQARGWSATGAGGRSVSRTVTPYNNGGGNFGRSVSTTGPNGGTASHSYNHSVDDGVVTSTRTATGVNGQTAASAVTRVPGQGGAATYVGPGGQTYTGSYTR